MTFPLAAWAGLVGVVLALGAGFWIYQEGRGAGRAETLKTTLETQRNITDADAHGPRTPDDVDRRLRDGRF